VQQVPPVRRQIAATTLQELQLQQLLLLIPS